MRSSDEASIDARGSPILAPMNEVVRRLVTRVVEKFAGSGVEIDAAGRLCLPDGLDTKRMHRFIELCLDQTLDDPKTALVALFRRVGIARPALRALDQVVGPHGELDFQAIARHSVSLGLAVPRLLEIPVRFRRFLIEDLALADPGCTTLEEAVVSTRHAAAERIGCRPTWDEILDHPAEVSALARAWREGGA
jgi:hypothetical protein